MKKIDYLQAEKIFNLLFWGGFVCTAIGLITGGEPAWAMYLFGGVGLLGIIGGLIFGLAAIRCPKCGKNLTIGRAPGVPNYCPHCGAKLK